MGKIISFNLWILASILLVRGESPVSSYGINGDSNRYEFSGNILNSAYIPGKQGHAESTDFYNTGNSGYSVGNVGNQENLEESLRSNLYSGFSPSSHNAGYANYATNTPESVGQLNFNSYGSTNPSSDTNFETYTPSTEQMRTEYSQFSTGKYKSPSYVRYNDNLSGASSVENYPESQTALSTEDSSYKGDYSRDTYRNHAASLMNGADQTLTGDTSSLFNQPLTDYSYAKPKENVYGIVGSHKYANDPYTFQSENRYTRGRPINIPRDYVPPVYMVNPGNNPYSNVRGNPTIAYTPGKLNKYSKYLNKYSTGGDLNYLSKEQNIEYLLDNYGKGSGKLTTVKETRPGSSYAAHSYLADPSYLSKVMGGYKSKPSFTGSYYGSSPVSYQSMSGLHRNYNDHGYAESPLSRRYRSSNYVSGYGSTYPGYY